MNLRSCVEVHKVYLTSIYKKQIYIATGYAKSCSQHDEVSSNQLTVFCLRNLDPIRIWLGIIIYNTIILVGYFCYIKVESQLGSYTETNTEWITWYSLVSEGQILSWECTRLDMDTCLAKRVSFNNFYKAVTKGILLENYIYWQGIQCHIDG